MKKLTTLILLGFLYLSAYGQSTITISSCETLSICNFNADCSPLFQEFSIAATTDCSQGNNLNFSYEIDFNNDDSVDDTGNNALLEEFFPNGQHRIIFTVTDMCNTSEVCEFLVDFVDCKKPTPICIFGIATTAMPTSGEVTVSASDFISDATFDNCSDFQNLKFSFSNDIDDTEKIIICDDIGSDGLVPLTIFVTDEDGQFDFCQTFLNVIDPNDTCPDPPTIGGFSSVTPDGLNIEGVQYTNGFSVPVSLNLGDLIKPLKTNNPKNGVTTFDVVLISKHIIATGLFQEDWQKVAADFNQDGNITVLDMILITNLILQNNSDPTIPSWAFIPSEFEIPDNFMSFEFLGVKLGDVNGTATPMINNPTVETRTLDGTLQLTTTDLFLEKGKTYSIPVFAKNFTEIAGGQFTLNFDPQALDFQEIESNNIGGLSNEGFGISKSGEGTILTSWANASGHTIDSEEAFYNIIFTANENGQLSDFLSINSKVLAAEAYVDENNQIEIWNIELGFENSNSSDGVAVLPNPFSSQTQIVFSLEKSSRVQLNIFDINGRLIFSDKKAMSAGKNQFEINAIDMPSNGIYFYKIETEMNTWNGKIIKN